MENYLNSLRTAILLRKASCQSDREKVYASARQTAHQFLKSNAAYDVDFFEELFLLEASIDEVEHSMSSQDSTHWKLLQGSQLAA